jgi:hypothetical protein
MRSIRAPVTLAILGALTGAGCQGPPGPQGPVGPPGPPGGAAGVLLLSGSANVSDASLTRYAMLARENQPDGREDTVLYALPRGGTLQNLFVVPATTLEAAGAVIQITIRVNQVDTALSVTHTQALGDADLSDTTTVVPVNQGDRVSIRFQETAGVDPIVTPGLFANYNVTLELH